MLFAFTVTVVCTPHCTHTHTEAVGEPQGSLLFRSYDFCFVAGFFLVLFSKLETRKGGMEKEQEGLCSGPEFIFIGYTLKQTGFTLKFFYLKLDFSVPRPVLVPPTATTQSQSSRAHHGLPD